MINLLLDIQMNRYSYQKFLLNINVFLPDVIKITDNDTESTFNYNFVHRS